LTTQERAVVMTMRDDQCSIRTIAKRLGRAPSSISRELRRAPGSGAYDANLAHLQNGARRIAPRRLPKLDTDRALFQVVRHYLHLRWSPQQIANILRLMWPDDSDKTVSHETIYNAIYLHPRAELKRELIACLRHHNQVRKHPAGAPTAAARSRTCRAFISVRPRSRTVSFPATGKVT
jgi:IS30 family transposase